MLTLHNVSYTHKNKPAADQLINKIHRFCTNLSGYFALLLMVLKQKPNFDSIVESKSISKELIGTQLGEHTLNLPKSAEFSVWKVARAIKKLRKWQFVSQTVCLDKVYINEKPNYNTLFGQSEPNRVNRKRRISADIYRIRGKSTNSW